MLTVTLRFETGTTAQAFSLNEGSLMVPVQTALMILSDLAYLNRDLDCCYQFQEIFSYFEYFNYFD